MRRMLAFLATFGLLAGAAFAQAPPETPICRGAPCFTADNPGVVSGSVTAGGVAQASTTAGQTGALMQGAVTTTPPTYATGTTNPLSLDTYGGLRTGAQSYTAVGCPAAAPTCGTNQAGFTVSTSSAHAANDNVGAAAAALTFAGICPAAGREITFTGTRLRYDVAAVPAGMTSFTLYLYSVTPPSAYADDAPWQLLSGDRASFLGKIDLGSPVLPSAGSTSLIVETNGNQKQVTCASTNTFGYLVTNGAYTTAAETVALTLKAVAP